MSQQAFLRSPDSGSKIPLGSYPARSAIERLPREILAEILNSLNPPATKSKHSSNCLANTLPNPPNTHPLPPNPQATLFAVLLTSRTLHTASLPLLYRNISPKSHSAIRKFAAQLNRYPHLGKLVRTFDISGLEFRRQKGEAKLQEDSAANLQKCIPKMPLLEELRGPGFNNEALDFFLLRSVLSGELGLERLRKLEWSPYVTDDMAERLLAVPVGEGNGVRELRLRGGDERLSPVVGRILGTMPKIRELELSETEVSAGDLSGLQGTARLTRLSVKPGEDSNVDLAKLMASRPEITSELEVLNLEGRTFQDHGNQSQSPDELSDLLSRLPKTLKSLNINTATIHPSHLSELGRLCGHLTELRLGPGLTFRELESLLIPGLENDEFAEDEREDGGVGIASKYMTVLSPIADAVAICRLRRRLASVPANNPMGVREGRKLKLRYLDIRSMDIEEQRKVKGSVLLGECCAGLEVIELSESVYLTDERMGRVLGSVGWGVRCRGGRCWIERK